MMREGFLMMKTIRNRAVYPANVAFMPALTPLEAAVIPARIKESYGTLSMIRHAYEAGDAAARWSQRAKICVR